MQIFSTKKDLQEFIQAYLSLNKSIGFVPTMGALHPGHLTLVKQALAENNLVVVSIFVNPTQFDNANDLKNYPRSLDSDVQLLQSVSNQIVVYAPTVSDIYQENVKAGNFTFGGIEHEMEGKFRKGHFNGVATIVKRLFEIVQPDKAYFGKKDYQQLQIIKKLVEKHSIPVQIIGCEIFRETNGLAMSSRNARLKPAYKKAAPFIYQTLKTAKKQFGTKSANKVTNWVYQQFKSHDLLELEYFTIANAKTLKTVKRKTKKQKYRAFIAVYAGDIRLIDNIALN